MLPGRSAAIPSIVWHPCPYRGTTQWARWRSYAVPGTACRRMPRARSRVPVDRERPHPTGQGSAETHLGDQTATAIIAISRCDPKSVQEWSVRLMGSNMSMEQQQDKIGDVVSSDGPDDRPEKHEIPFALALEKRSHGSFQPELREPADGGWSQLSRPAPNVMLAK